MERLRPLSETECYKRLYGNRLLTVAVIREPEPERRSGGLLGEQLRQLFELRADEPFDELREVEAA
ncbi:MAG TPA: hypothetical protein VJT84_08960 [Gaiellaceae bacterium]|nr:hypothetical protein [Gaiellaceae bacterium]